MLTLTKRLKAYAIKRWNLDEDVSDAKVKTLLGRKLLDKLLTTDDIEKINRGENPVKRPAKSADPEPKKKTKPNGKKSTDTGRDADDAEPRRRKNSGDRDDAEEDDEDEIVRRRKAKKQRQQAEDERINNAVSAALKAHGLTPAGGSVDPISAFTKSTKIRVKEAAENYDTARKAATYPMTRQVGGREYPHPFAGQPARYANVDLNHPSDRDKAVAQAWLKYQINRSPMSRGTDMPRWTRFTDADRELLLYAAHNEKWVGQIQNESGTTWVKRQKLHEWQIKAMLDDSTSGGIEITPVVFDDALVLTPVLYGELFPFIRVENVARGRRVKGGQMINPEFTSGVGEGTAITPFNTSSFVTAFDTPIYPAVSAIELGQDFEEDSPVDLGAQIVERFGLKALEYLDRVIAVGNGYNEPQGFFNATGATLTNSVFGAGGPITVADYEAMMFGVAKEYRTEAAAFLAFVSNDYTYRKARAINVGPGDQRRVFGMDHQKYQLLDTVYKVQNSITDGWAAFVNLRRYRMYRRLGMQIRVETGGRQLALSNTRLIVVRMRYGGQLEKGAAAALMKDLQAA